MSVRNRDIAAILSELADLLDIRGANDFRVNAYRNAARTLTNLDRQVTRLLDEGNPLPELPGIGERMATKIEEIVRSGRLEQLDELRREMDSEVTELLKIPDVGPQTAGTLYRELGITDATGLSEAAADGRIEQLEGFGERSQQKLKRNADRFLASDLGSRTPLGEVDRIVEPLVAYLAEHPATRTVEAAGSYRRRRDTVGDIDIVVECEDNAAVMEAFVAYDRVERVISGGETRTSVVLVEGVQVDLRAVAPESYGAALYYFTGSADHNVALRRIAQERGLKINEYGVFRNGDRVGGETEASVPAAVDLPLIPPELREDRGEIEAARGNQLPSLVGLEDIRGDLHMHTTATDGRNSIAEMARAAAERGYDYIAITDHSQRSRVTNGLDANRLLAQVDRIAELNESSGVHILSGIEVDILEDGSLDLPDDVLARLDVVVASIHYGRDMSADEMTRRTITALDNRHVRILGHPTGRILGRREPHPIALETVLDAAAERGVAVELNASPQRLDLSDTACRAAAARGVTVAIDTDAHHAGGLAAMRYGIDTARRGWLTPTDVLNTRPLAELHTLLER